MKKTVSDRVCYFANGTPLFIEAGSESGTAIYYYENREWLDLDYEEIDYKSVIDELNSKLHPLLVRMIILMFKNKSINTNKAQLICSSHDTWQLSNDFLQRDEVWLVSK